VPAILFVAYLVIRYRADLVNRRLVVLAFLIVVVHIVIVSGFAHWWGGHSFGPRFTTGTIPWLVLLTILGLGAMAKAQSHQPDRARLSRSITLSIGVALLAASVFTNARGALSADTLEWNSKPLNIDQHPERLWSWRYPQFLAGLIHPPLPTSVPILPYEARIDFGSEQAEQYLWFGWSGGEQTFRWTDGKEAAIIFSLKDPKPIVLRINMGAFLRAGRLESQTLLVNLNGKRIASTEIIDSQARVYSFALPEGILRQKNILTFELPDAESPESLNGETDRRELGLSVEWLQLSTDLSAPRT